FDRVRRRLIRGAACGVLAASSLFADGTRNFAVQLTAQPQSSPPAINLSWVQDDIATPNFYVVSRKSSAATSWTPLIMLPGTATSYTDTTVSAGTPYEYQVFKQASGYTGYGYIYAGINVPLTEFRGTVLLVVDNSFSTSLA